MAEGLLLLLEPRFDPLERGGKAGLGDAGFLCLVVRLLAALPRPLNRSI